MSARISFRYVLSDFRPSWIGGHPAQAAIVGAYVDGQMIGSRTQLKCSGNKCRPRPVENCKKIPKAIIFARSYDYQV